MAVEAGAVRVAPAYPGDPSAQSGTEPLTIYGHMTGQGQAAFRHQGVISPVEACRMVSVGLVGSEEISTLNVAEWSSSMEELDTKTRQPAA